MRAHFLLQQGKRLNVSVTPELSPQICPPKGPMEVGAPSGQVVSNPSAESVPGRSRRLARSLPSACEETMLSNFVPDEGLKKHRTQR